MEAVEVLVEMLLRQEKVATVVRDLAVVEEEQAPAHQVLGEAGVAMVW